SRFPVRIKLDYPPEDVELEIVKKHILSSSSASGGGGVGGNDDYYDEDTLKQGIKLANTLRQAAAVEELFYSPSMRETIAFGKLVNTGVAPKNAANIIFGNVYSQWGQVEYQKVSDIIASMFGN
ncbi:MAG: hypothetical protein GWO20_02765, partial [Candidatus Korarchaeota archaeon]|nr:hypothetical protein [Candidatus Korarchaeota archaeon]